MAQQQAKIVGRLQVAGTLRFINSKTGEEKVVTAKGSVPLVPSPQEPPRGHQ